MSECINEISVSETEAERPRMLRVAVRDALSWEPLIGAKVRFTIEGDGTLEASQTVTQYDCLTDDQGHAFATWWEYPRYLPRRELHSVVRAECAVADAEIALTNLDSTGSVKFMAL